MRKIMFILNPNASGFNIFDFKKGIEEYLISKEIDFEYDIKCTKKFKDAIDIANNAVKDGYTELVAVGGDGTINEVGDVVVKNKLKLGIIPAGTGNDYFNSLGESTDFEYCMEKILKGESREIDYGTFLNKTFFNIASVGFDAEVNDYALKVKKFIKSGLSYKIAIALALINYKRKQYKVIIDDKEYKDDFFLIAIGIGSKYGGNINILPKADVNDGLLDICMIKYKSKFNILRKIKTLINSTHINEDITLYFKAKNIKILADDIEINYDGEYMKVENNIEFSITNDKIKVLI